MIYQGFLLPWVDQILREHKAGKMPREIARKLWPKVHAKFLAVGDPWFGGPVGLEANIRYVIHREGFSLRKPLGEAARLKRQRERIRAWMTPAREPSKPTLGRPLDMGGPRDVWIERGPWDAF